jgi:fatty acid desaturase
MVDMHNERATIGWYRTQLPRETRLELIARSDFKGMLQSGGFLGIWCCTGAATAWSGFAGHWALTPLLLFVHGMVAAFMINAVHELCHNTVFKTKWLNSFFVRLFSFLGWNDWIWFNASHANHHRYTLHPPRDGEVVLPVSNITHKNFWRMALWAPLGTYDLIKVIFKRAWGIIDDDWTRTLFPKDDPAARRRLFNWSRSVLGGHVLIVATCTTVAVLTQQWAWLLVGYVISFGFTFGGWLFYLCNNSQHVGLTDKVPDFRVCCRSVKLPWIVSILYWRMEYHTEHHMYAAVPCYNLPKLRKLIDHDLPERKGLIATWKEIDTIIKKQASDPDYQYLHPFPESATPPTLGNREQEMAAGAGPADPLALCDELNIETPTHETT